MESYLDGCKSQRPSCAACSSYDKAISTLYRNRKPPVKPFDEKVVSVCKELLLHNVPYFPPRSFPPRNEDDRGGEKVKQYYQGTKRKMVL